MMHFPRTIYYYYYVLLRHNGSKTYSSVHTHTVIHANTSTKNTKRFKNSKNGKKRNRTGKTRSTLGLLYCAGGCVPYSLLYCLPADVSRRQGLMFPKTKNLYLDVRLLVPLLHHNPCRLSSKLHLLNFLEFIFLNFFRCCTC